MRHDVVGGVVVESTKSALPKSASPQADRAWHLRTQPAPAVRLSRPAARLLAVRASVVAAPLQGEKGTGRNADVGTWHAADDLHALDGGRKTKRAVLKSLASNLRGGVEVVDCTNCCVEVL